MLIGQLASLEQFHWFVRAHLESTSGELSTADARSEKSAARSAEADKVGSGEWSVESSPLSGAPHTAEVLLDPSLGYDAATAVFPRGFDPDKYWPPVRRIDQAYGDRNLVCSCPPPEAFALADTDEA